MEYHSFWHVFQILSFLEYLVFFGVSFALRIVKMILWFINIHLANNRVIFRGGNLGMIFWRHFPKDISINEKNAKYKVKLRHYKCPFRYNKKSSNFSSTHVRICVNDATPLIVLHGNLTTLARPCFKRCATLIRSIVLSAAVARRLKRASPLLFFMFSM